MHDERHDAHRPGGPSRQEGNEQGNDKSERKPLFSTRFNPREEKGEAPPQKESGNGSHRKRPPRRRISSSPGQGKSAPSEPQTYRERFPDFEPQARRESFSGEGSRDYDSVGHSSHPAPQKRANKPGSFSNKPSRPKSSSGPGRGSRPGPKGPSRPGVRPGARPGPKTGKPFAKEKPLKKSGPKPVFPKAPYIPTIIEGPVRLNKFIAASGICSRREADKLIENGEITVNGELITTLGARVQPGDIVMRNNKVLKCESKYYILLNKPKGFVTTMEDPEERETVMELVKNACKERIFPVGRLDRNTTGLLLFTNDGELAKKLTHPTHRIRKIYHVELDRPLSKSDMMQIAHGIHLEDGLAEVDAIAYVGTGEDRKQVGIELHSGKNRVVRRIFESLRYHVQKLDRVSFGSLTKKNLPRGRWRYLTQHEVNFLKML